MTDISTPVAQAGVRPQWDADTAKDMSVKAIEAKRIAANPDKAAMRTILAAIRRGDARIALQWLVETGAIKRMSRPAADDTSLADAIAGLLPPGTDPSSREARPLSDSDKEAGPNFPDPPSYLDDPARVKPQRQSTLMEVQQAENASKGIPPPRMRRQVKRKPKGGTGG